MCICFSVIFYPSLIPQAFLHMKGEKQPWQVKFVISLKAAGVEKSTFQVKPKRKSGFLLVMFRCCFCVYNMLANKLFQFSARIYISSVLSLRKGTYKQKGTEEQCIQLLLWQNVPLETIKLLVNSQQGSHVILMGRTQFLPI